MKDRLHVDLLRFSIDDGSLGEARVRSTEGREIRPNLAGSAALGVINPQVREVPVLPLASEDEYRLPGRFEKHGMTW